MFSLPDDDLVAMYLTDKGKGINRELDDHEELEVLLESFSKQVEEIVNEAENIEVRCYIWLPLTSSCKYVLLQSNVQSTQEIVELILDSNRNSLLALDLKVRDVFQANWPKYDHLIIIAQVSIGTMGIGTGALVAGMFGMNVCPFVF